MTNPKPASKERAAELIKAAMVALDEAGGDLAFTEVKREVEKRVELTEADRFVYEKTGYVRWNSVLHFFSIRCVKAGFIKKNKGRWYLTPEGRSVVSLPGIEIIDRSLKAYRAWKAEQTADEIADETATTDDDSSTERSLAFETAEAQARSEIVEYVRGIGPYEFQDLVAALLRGMGYSTPFVAPKGPDGGTDIIAYSDPLGVSTPHLRVQVKHRASTKATREEVAALRGIIRQDREVGLFVSSGGFTSEAAREARQGGVHIEMVDLDRFLEMWIGHYEHLSEEDRGLLRLRTVHFLSPE